MDVFGADGNMLPYVGYIEAEIQIPFLPPDNNTIVVPLLVTAFTDYKVKVPIIIGTNVIWLFSDLDQSDIQIPEAWKMAFTCLNIDSSEPVRTSNKYPIFLGLNEVKTIHGLVKNTGKIKEAVTEQMNTSQSGNLIVCPRVISLEGATGKKTRFPVRICNLSTSTIKVPERSIV